MKYYRVTLFCCKLAGYHAMADCSHCYRHSAKLKVLLEAPPQDLKWNVEKLHEAMKRHKLKASQTQWSSVGLQHSVT